MQISFNVNRYITFCTTVILFTLNAHANVYYVSSISGNDQRSGEEAKQINTPWKTLAKVSEISSTFKAGDSILFKRGEMFAGTLQINASGIAGKPIVFSAYGTGTLPEITGFITATGWQQLQNGIWETTVSNGLDYMNTIVINGIAMPCGRYPNASATGGGYLFYDSFSGNKSITDKKLASLPSWSGGEVVIRKARWVVDRNKITSQTGNTINYMSQSPNGALKGYGYFIQNHPSTLDIEGEWYYKADSKKLGIFTGSTNPTNYQVRAGVQPILVHLANQKNVHFINLIFSGATSSAFKINSCQNINIENCHILFSGRNAVEAGNTSTLSIKNVIIAHSGNTACNISNCINTILANNKISNTGMLAGMGDGDTGSYEGIIISGDNNTVQNNVIDSTGYVPITFSGNNVEIKNNVISNYALVKDDGGAIYTWNNSAGAPVNYGRVVTGNIIRLGKGAAAGTPDPNKWYAHGIYIDDNSSHVEISYNSVTSCAQYGIYIHNAHDINIKGNTLYNNNVQLEMEHDNIDGNSKVINNNVTSNFLVAKQLSQLCAEYKTNDNGIAAFGNFDSNYYYKPLDNDLVIKVLQQVNGVYSYKAMSLGSWKAIYNKDVHSLISLHVVKPYTITNQTGTNQIANGSFTSNGGGLYVYAAANNCTASWATGPLDGGNLKVSFSSVSGKANYASLIIGVGAIAAGKTYQLKFSMLGADVHNAITAYLRQSVGSYKDLSVRKAATITQSRLDKAFIFTASTSENNASVVFDIPEQSSPVYLDNIQLNKVEAAITNADNFVHFFYNSSTVPHTYNIAGKNYDAAGTRYQNSVKINGFGSVVLVTDKAVTTDSSVASTCQATGFILREQWDHVPGNNITDFPWQKVPTSTSFINSFEGPVDIADSYASRIRGYICAPQTGDYTFWIAADDAAELWLSTDDNPANKIRIANLLSWTSFREWNKFSSQKSYLITMEAGNKYYVEALQKEGAGSDNLSVQWKLPDGIMQAPIPGLYLSPYIIQSTTDIENGGGKSLAMDDAESEIKNLKEGLTVFPNPVKKQTQVQFAVNKTGKAAVNLYDSKGILVKKLFDGESKANTPVSLVLNCESLLNGVYLIHLVSGKMSLSKKIIVMN